MQGKTIVVTGALGALGKRRRRDGGEAGRVGRAHRSREGRSRRLRWAARRERAHCRRRRSDLACGSRDRDGIGQGEVGRIDALLNIAGGFQWEAVEDGKPETWDRMFALNLKTALTPARPPCPICLESGAGRSSMSALLSACMPRPDLAPTRPAIRGASADRKPRRRLKLKGVTVNAVIPSIIDTATNRRDMPKADFSAGSRRPTPPRSSCSLSRTKRRR